MMDDTLVCCECGNENITLVVVFKEGDDNRNYDFCCHKCNTIGHIEDMVTWEQYKTDEDTCPIEEDD